MIKKTMSNKFRGKIKNMQYKLGNGNSEKKIVRILKQIKTTKELLLKD